MANRKRLRRMPNWRLPFRFVLLGLTLSLVAAGLGSLIFFRVLEVEVVGNERYSSETVLEASGIRLGKAMFSVRPSRTEINISRKLSYVESVKVKLSFPNRVVIRIQERYPVASLFVSGDWWILDKNCRLLEYGTQETAMDRIVLRGVTGINPSVGETIGVAEGQESRLERIVSVLNAVCEAGLAERITSLDVSSPGNILLFCGEKITIRLGSGEGAEENLLLFAEIADRLDPDQECVVSFGAKGEVHISRK